MKRIITICLALICFAINVSAQEKTINNGLGFGFQLTQYQKDFGFGLSATSPHFAQGNIAVRLRGNLMYNEHLKNNEIIRTPY